MTNVKRLGLAAIAAAAMMVGVSACDDAEGDDGGSGGAGGTGGIGGIGGSDPGPCEGTTCAAGEAPDAACACRPSCADITICEPLDAYCASDNLCYGVDTDPGQDCARAALAPAREASGPLLYAPTQVDADPANTANCTKDPAACTNNGNVCKFQLYVFDPDGDLPSGNGALYADVLFVKADGTGVSTFDVPRLADGVLEVSLCFGEDEVAPAGAIQVLDQADHHSNASCIAGVAP